MALGVAILLSLEYLLAWWSVRNRAYLFSCGLLGHLCAWLVGFTVYLALRTRSPELRGFICFVVGLLSFVANFILLIQLIDLSPEDQRREGFKLLPLGLLMFSSGICSGFLLQASKHRGLKALGFLLLVGIGLVMLIDLPRML